jgi:hypothetical protein
LGHQDLIIHHRYFAHLGGSYQLRFTQHGHRCAIINYDAFNVFVIGKDPFSFAI